MDYSRLKVFTLKNMIVRAVLDAHMNLALSHITMSVLVCTKILLLFGNMLRRFHGEAHLLHDLITQVFLRSLQYGGFLDACFCLEKCLFNRY